MECMCEAGQLCSNLVTWWFSHVERKNLEFCDTNFNTFNVCIYIYIIYYILYVFNYIYIYNYIYKLFYQQHLLLELKTKLAKRTCPVDHEAFVF